MLSFQIPGIPTRAAWLAAILSASTLQANAELVGQWTFENGSLADAAGNFGDLILEGNASVTGGALNINGSGTNASGWAHTPASGGGVAVGAKTLVSWITLESLSDVAVAGSALTLDSVSVDKFDGIVFAERQANRWMSGSNGFSRTPEFQFDQTAVSVETATGNLIQLAVTYEDIGGTARITGYRDGVLMGTYDFGAFATWAAGEQEVAFGKRHLFSPTDGPGALDALVHEARIYDTALTQAEIQALVLTTSEDSDNDDLDDAWELTYTDNLADLDGKAAGPGPGAESGDFDGDGLTDLDEQARLTNPVNPDTDGDTLGDGSEVAGAGSRPPTSPTRSDTDSDGLSDFVETNSGTFVGPNDAGTNPVVADTDLDGFSDGDEVNNLHTNPLDPGEPAFTQSLLGHWTFEPGVELKDLTGNFPDLALEGDAAVVDGALNVNGSGTNASGWAHTPASGGGAAIGSKTLVSWITLESLSDVAVAGSALTLDSITADKFDGIVFAERQANRWMNGSNGFTRSPEFQFDQAAVSEETTTGNLVMLAITHEDLGGGQVQVTGYRDGVLMGTYPSAGFATWAAGDQEVLFGKRHLFSPTDGPGALDALIEEARLYGKAATAQQIMDLFAAGPIGGETLAITAYAYDPLAATFEITWVSKPGSFYRVEYSDDMEAWLEVTDSYPPGGATETRTTFLFEDIPPLIPARYFRVAEE